LVLFGIFQIIFYICDVIKKIIMGTNYYRIPIHEEMETRKQTLIEFVNNLDLSPENIECGFKIISPRKDWEWFSPWDMFLEGTNIHLGKRSSGWKFCWNFHKEKYYCDKESLLEFIRSGRVVDEYGEEHNVEEFITMALGWGEPDGWVVNEEYRRNERQKGHGSYWGDDERYDDRIVDGLRVSSATDFC
jgi:hypothetical protein